ncbi:MAG: glycogen debranching protein GlgX [Anaerolineae bacterium]|nr:glycogen debranching protein GlgX [Anaerolineae bacterium]
MQPTSGHPLPLGATVTADGANFAIFSRHATRVWLMLFDQPTDDTPTHEFELDPTTHRTGDIWHIHLSGLQHGQLYLYRVDGPYLPEQGHRFNRHKPLLDPYTRALTGGPTFHWDFSQSFGFDRNSPRADLSFSTTTNLAGMPKCIVYGDDGFDWQGDRPLNRPWPETIIYETHVRSLTCHPSANVNHPGTYAGVVEKIPHFKALGVTAIELLPIHQFDEWEFRRFNPKTGERLRNYWGYNTLCFFAPKGHYSHLGAERGQQVVAFKEMVRALHQAGLEVILDVVFNHTVEGNQLGPTLSFKGIDNSIYYILADNPRYYQDFTGVGNTLNANHPVVQDFIIDCLRYWVRDMHVDGFRFDLATSLTRERTGHISGNPPLTARIAEDPLLRTAKLIAEPWDVGGYQVGRFPGGRWAEWNDRYRDDIRRFWRGDPGLTGALATRLAGSADLYYPDGRSPNASINFVTAHDGFTANDLVSYNTKHNEANGEHNQDGSNHNSSYNYGVEGPTFNPRIEAIRSRQVKNFLATLMLSQGTPMLLGGDEFRRTQQGNNNAYCQHNEMSWYDWRFLEKHADIFRFARQVIALRQAHPVFRRTTFFTGHDLDDDQFRDIHWYGPSGLDASWEPSSKWLMCVMDGSKEEIGAPADDVDVLMMFNADTRPRLFYLPPAPHNGRWRLALDTGQPSPLDIHPLGEELELEATIAYPVKSRSIVVMISRWRDDIEL